MLRWRLLSLALAVPLLGVGCISFSGGADGGLFLTTDRGEEWSQRGAIPTVSGTARTLVNTDVRLIVQDPEDPRALYVGTETSGAYYSWDGGATWQVLGSPFARARVDAIVVDPRDRCAFFVAAGSKVFRSSDCARSWESSDFDVTVTALAIDPRSPAILYAGTSRGDVLRSTDSGRSWRATERIDKPIAQLYAASYGQATVVLAATRKDGMYRSTDGGASWVSLRDGMAEYRAAFDFRALAPAPKTPGVVLHASKYGVLRSADFGMTWAPLTLLTAPGSVDLFALAVDPSESRAIVYATGSTFYRTNDGGQSWESKKLPTARQPTALLVDARDGGAVWLGTKKVKK